MVYKLTGISISIHITIRNKEIIWNNADGGLQFAIMAFGLYRYMKLILFIVNIEIDSTELDGFIFS